MENRNGARGSSKQIQMLFSDITISDQDLALLKNLDPELHVRVMVRSEDELGQADIDDMREETHQEDCNVL